MVPRNSTFPHIFPILSLVSRDIAPHEYLMSAWEYTGPHTFPRIARTTSIEQELVFLDFWSLCVRAARSIYYIPGALVPVFIIYQVPWYLATLVPVFIIYQVPWYLALIYLPWRALLGMRPPPLSPPSRVYSGCHSALPRGDVRGGLRRAQAAFGQVLRDCV